MIAGATDTAATFNGTTSQVALPPGTVKKTRDMAVEVWFKNNITGGGGPLIGYQDKPLDGTPTTGVPILYVGTDGKLHGQLWSGTAAPITSPGLVNDGKWHHAVLSAMGSTQTLYLDGRTVGTLTGQTPNHITLTHNQIGAAYATGTWPAWGTTPRRTYNGTIDEVAIYQHPLGPDSVAAHQREGLRTADQLTKLTLPSGKAAAEMTYDDAGDRLTEYTDANGGTWTLKAPTVYGGDSDLRRAIEVRDPADRPHLYEYDALTGRMIRIGIPLGLDVREEDKPQPTTSTPSPTPTYICSSPDPGDPSFCTTLPGNPGEIPDFIGHNIDGMGIRTFDYDDRGNPTVITDENGDNVKLGYDARGNITTRTTCRTKDACHTAYYTYPAVTNPADPRNDRPTEYRDPRSTGLTDNRYRTTYTYTSAGNLATETNPAGGLTKYAYINGSESTAGGTMPAGLLRTLTDPRGAVTRHSYDPAGDLSQTVEPSGLTTGFITDAIGRLKSQTVVSDSVPDGATTQCGYDGLSNLTSVTEPAVTNAVTGFLQQQRTDNTYDPDGNLTEARLSDIYGGAEPRVTGYEYDEHNRLEKTVDAYGHETGYDHDRFGNLTAMVDAAGNRTEYAYTARNIVAEIRLRDFDGDPDEAPDPGDDLVLRSFAYDHAGRLVRDTDAMGRRVEYAYYSDGQLKNTTLKDFRDPEGGKRDYVLNSLEYDGAGNTIMEVAANGKTVTQYVVNNVGRVESETVDPGGLGRRTAFRYDSDGNVTQVSRSGAASNVPWFSSPTAETIDLTYDPAGRLTKQAATDGDTTLTTSYGYDQRDLVIKQVDPRGNAAGADEAAYTTTIAYDQLGLPIKTTGPPLSAESGGGQPITMRPETIAGYNAFGDRTEMKDPLGNVSRTEYDQLGQAVKDIAPAYTPPGSTTSIRPTTVTHFDPVGNVSEVVDARGGSTRFDYDRLGRLKTRDEPYKTYDERVQWRYTYTRTGQLLSATDPNGARDEATYDDLDRPVTATQVERRPSPAAFTSRYSYDDVGNLLTSTSPAGAATANTYDALGQLTKTVKPAGVVGQYGYDGHGNPVRASDGLGRTAKQVFDPFGRLSAQADLKADGTELRRQKFTYDPTGNMTERTDALGHATRFDYNALNLPTRRNEPVSDTSSITTTFGYDAAGNRTRFTDGRGNSTTYTHNALGLPESLTEPATAAHPGPADRTWTNTYDAVGNP